MAPVAAELNASTGFDWRLLHHDVAGSVAHARMLARQGIVPPDDADRIIAGLRDVEKDIKEGKVILDPALEDLHMNIEVRLTERIGEPGLRLHTARSRNDQVATDLRLYGLAACGRLLAYIDDVRRALVELARKHVDTLAPGYTHLQRAQPIRLAHHFLAYVVMLTRDRGRLIDAARRMDESPLGAGALAATTFPIDRAGVAKDLGFGGVTRNSLDAVGDRDFAIELVAMAALTQAHLSRLAEELVLWVTQEFAVAKLPEGFCSGSSIMPQKVNPDIAELVRAKTGRINGDLVALLTIVKALPLAYNKDLQETQEPLYDAVDTLAVSLRAMAGLLRGLELDVARLARAVEDGYVVATELADYLAAKGVPFRRAHDVAGAVVRKAAARGLTLAALPLAELQAEAPEFQADVSEWLDPARAVDRRNVTGGPAKPQILAELAAWDKELGG